jgi:hypothetical protein
MNPYGSAFDAPAGGGARSGPARPAPRRLPDGVRILPRRYRPVATES